MDTRTTIKPAASSSNTRNYILGGVLFLAAIGTLILAESINKPKK